MEIEVIAFLALVLSATLTPAAAQHSSPTPVDKCGQILNEPGEYVLTRDLGCQGDGITINASNVHFDMAENGLGAINAALVIADGASHVLVDGGGALGGGSGLIIGHASDIIVTNLKDINGDPDLGCCETGVSIYGGSDITITDVAHIYGPGAITGWVNRGIFSHNVIYGDGIDLSGHDNVIRNNTTHSCFGIVVANHNLVRDNEIDISESGCDQALQSNGNVGISVGDENEVRGNIIHDAAVGISLGGDANRITRNTVDDNSNPDRTIRGQYGIYTGSGATGNLIEHNTATGNKYDLYESNGPPCVNVWRKNNYQTSSGAVACIQ